MTGDLRQQGVQETGRLGLQAEAVLRYALLKQYRQLSYEELAFHLEDSASFRAFARLPSDPGPDAASRQERAHRLYGGHRPGPAEATKEAQHAGINLAKATGERYKGRKPSFSRGQFETVRNMLGQAAGVSMITHATGLSRQTIYRIKHDAAGSEAALISGGSEASTG